MSTDHRHASSYVERLLRNQTPDDLTRRLTPKLADPMPRIPRSSDVSPTATDARWQTFLGAAESRDALLDAQTVAQCECYHHNIENFIGTVKVPVGIAGPLRVNGIFAQGDYYIPLATTEAALVASYNRGAQLVSEAGGCTSVLLNEGISRAPGFAFRDLEECGRFLLWATANLDNFRRAAEATTRHGRLTDMRLTVEGNHVYLGFEYTTGDASGQNMTTIATQAICDYIKANCPIQPQYSFIEANLSGDKKASAQSFLLVRGKKVSAEVLLPGELIEKRLHTTAEQMVNYWRMSCLGGVLSGTLGVQGHYANGLAALYIACGQDAACVAESAVGVTRFEATARGELYASVTMPNIMVGTVGGGTGLPSQKACLDVLGLAGAGKAQAFAEVCCGVCLAGELSIIGALASDDFARAHQLLARARRSPDGARHAATEQAGG
jgi:hydroxymethylglutaryl-CoA reductase (NADPH)